MRDEVVSVCGRGMRDANVQFFGSLVEMFFFSRVESMPSALLTNANGLTDVSVVESQYS
jgi:hypothetical protein